MNDLLLHMTNQQMYLAALFGVAALSGKPALVIMAVIRVALVLGGYQWR